MRTIIKAKKKAQAKMTLLLLVTGVFAMLALLVFMKDSHKKESPSHKHLSSTHDQKTSDNRSNQKSSQSEHQSHAHAHQHGSHNGSHKKTSDNITHPLGPSTPIAVFKKKQDEIFELEKKLPHSKEQLIDIITLSDPFKELDHSQMAHSSLNEVKQNTLGAIKVMALRALIKNSSKETLEEDFHTIITRSKDPTMVNMAKAARDSVRKGRPFFEDLTEAINQL